MPYRSVLAAAVMLAASSVAAQEAPEAARQLAQDAIIVDTHIDAPGILLSRWADLGVEAPDREFDYPRSREGGLDVAGQRDKMRDACKRLADAGIQVSLFIDADEEQIKAAAEVGAPFIEIHTGCYADAKTDAEQAQELARIAKAATFAASLGLKVNAGHGLTYHNVKAIAAIPEMHELNIGHAIIGRAVMTGLKDAVAEMKRLMLEARG